MGARRRPIAERIEAVRAAHAMGIFTWVSIEPVVDTAEALDVIAALRDDVDLWKVGKLNHDAKREAAIDWQRFLTDVETALAGRQYLIEKDLQRFRIRRLAQKQILKSARRCSIRVSIDGDRSSAASLA